MREERDYLPLVINFWFSAHLCSSSALCSLRSMLLHTCAPTHQLYKLSSRQGQELRNDVDVALLERDAQVFVSAGEAFKDPIAETQRRLLRVERASKRPGYFPASGTHLQSHSTSQVGNTVASSSTPSIRSHSLRAERIQKLLAEARPRALVFSGEDGRHGVEVVQGSMERFLDECTVKLQLPTPCKHIYSITGEEATVLPTQLCHRSLFWLLGRVAGPFWVTTGAGLPNLRGPRSFLKELRTRLLARRRAVTDRLGQYHGSSEALADAASEVTRRLDHLLDIEKMTFYQLRAHQDQLNETLAYLESAATEVEEAEETMIGNESSAIAEEQAVKKGRRFMGRPALRLQVYLNGKEPMPGSEKIVCFDLDNQRRGLDNNDALLERLVEMCTHSLNSTLKGRRLYLSNGREINSTLLLKLKRDTQVWLSCGEPFTPLSRLVLDIREEWVTDTTGTMKPGEEESQNESPSSFHAPPGSPRDAVPMKRLSLMCTRIGSGKFSPSQHWTLVRHTIDQASLPNTLSVSATSLGLGSSSFALLVCAAYPGLAATVHPTVSGGGEQAVLSLEPIKAPPYLGQLWMFSTNGTIASVLHPHLLLTVPAQLPPERLPGDDSSDVLLRDFLDPEDMSVRLLPAEPASSRIGKRQRWGIRQDNFASIGQWRLSVTARHLRQFAKDALLWPVLPSGDWNEELSWPLTGALVGEVCWEEGASAGTADATKPIFVRILLNGKLASCLGNNGREREA